MKAIVDQDICIGCGLCAEIASEIFELKDDKAHVKISEIPESLLDKAKEAAQSCPVDAISIS